MKCYSFTSDTSTLLRQYHYVPWHSQEEILTLYTPLHTPAAGRVRRYCSMTTSGLKARGHGDSSVSTAVPWRKNRVSSLSRRWGFHRPVHRGSLLTRGTGCGPP